MKKQPKKVYAAPSLTVYGSMHALTQKMVTGPNPDATAMLMGITGS